MNPALLQRLREAQTDEARQAIVLEMSLASLPDELQRAVSVAAVPHWFDAVYFEALWGEESLDLYEDLIDLSFVELIPRRGFAIHERTRQQLLKNFWHVDRDGFIEITRRAADYCDAQGEVSYWQAEEVYHRLLSQPEQGIADLQSLATAWANYEYHSYSEIEQVVNLADEQISAGRLTGRGADWTRLWQAKLALIYGLTDVATSRLDQIAEEPGADPLLTAEVNQARGDVSALLGNPTGMKIAWRTAVERYRQLPDDRGKLDAALVEEKLRRHNLLEDDPDATVKPSRPPSANALRLIDNVHAAWIEGVLKKAVDEAIDLHVTRDAGQQANMILHRPHGSDRPVPAGHRLSRLLAAADSALLILGAPGSGKTFTLLQLLDELLEQARQDGDALIPLLFNLSSFGSFARDKDVALVDWLANRARHHYGLKPQTTREQLSAGNTFILLLDGLDEVTTEENMRERCVEAINQFMAEFPGGLVVCSRIGDYQQLQNRLSLVNALVLQPLTDDQIAATINRAGETQRSAMRAQMKGNWRLRETLRSPLLLTLYRQAYPALQVVDEKNGLPSGRIVQMQRQALFAAYVDMAFAESDKIKFQERSLSATDAAGRKEKHLHWLSVLANRMQKVRSTVFFVEALQPTWLPEGLVRRYRAIYGFALGLAFGLPFSLLVGLILGGIAVNGAEPLIGLALVPTCTVIGGLVYALGGAVVNWVSTGRRPWLAITLIAVAVLACNCCAFFAGFVMMADSVFRDLAVALFFIVLGYSIVGVGFIVSMLIAASSAEIRLREQIRPSRPSRRKVLRQARNGLIAGTIIGTFALLLGLLLGTGAPIILLIGGAIFGAIFGGLVPFLEAPHLDARPEPGRGVGASLRNSLIVTVSAAILFSLTGFVIAVSVGGGILAVVLVGIMVQIVAAPPIFTFFGGLAWLQHRTLRFMLVRRDWLPRRLVPWLNTMTGIGILRRVGGGYIFIHRTLLEYLSAQADIDDDGRKRGDSPSLTPKPAQT